MPRGNNSPQDRIILNNMTPYVALNRAELSWQILFALMISFFVANVWMTRATNPENVVAQERSLYRDVFITENNGVRCLQFERVTRLKQSCVDIAAPQRLLLDYARATLLASAMIASPNRALFLGLGSGSIPDAFLRTFPEMKATVVEIDDAVLRAARLHFNFPVDSSRTSVYVGDARVFTHRAIMSSSKYDVIVLDVFDENHIPEHLMTVEFMKELGALLSLDGVLVINTFSPLALYEMQVATVRAIFPKVFMYQSAVVPAFTKQAASRVLFAQGASDQTSTQIIQHAEVLAPALREVAVDVHLLLALTTVAETARGRTVLTDKISGANARLWQETQTR